MSAAVAASSASTAPAAAPVTPGQSTQGKAAPAVTGQEKTTGVQPQGTPKAPAATAPTEEEFEEIKIGAVSGKVPKELAKAMKEVERGFHAKSQENAKTHRDFQALAKAFKANPDIGFEVFGVDADQYSQARMARYLEDQMMTPEQKKLRTLEEENKTFKQRQDEEKKRQEQEQLSAAEAQEEREITQSLFKAWKAAFDGDEPDPWIAQKIVATFAAAQEQKLGWTWEQCAARVKQDLETADKRRLSKMPVDAIREILGPEVLKKLRDDDVRRVTEKASEAAAKRANQSASPGEKKPASPKKNFEGRKVVTQDEWDAAWNTE